MESQSAAEPSLAELQFVTSFQKFEELAMRRRHRRVRAARRTHACVKEPDGAGAASPAVGLERETRVGEDSGRRLIDPPRRTHRDDLEHDQLKVGVSMVPDIVHNVRVFDKAAARGVDERCGRIGGMVESRRARFDRNDRRTGMRVPAAEPAWRNLDVRDVHV